MKKIIGHTHKTGSWYLLGFFQAFRNSDSRELLTGKVILCFSHHRITLRHSQKFGDIYKRMELELFNLTLNNNFTNVLCSDTLRLTEELGRVKKELPLRLVFSFIPKRYSHRCLI